MRGGGGVLIPWSSAPVQHLHGAATARRARARSDGAARRRVHSATRWRSTRRARTTGTTSRRSSAPRAPSPRSLSSTARCAPPRTLRADARVVVETRVAETRVGADPPARAAARAGARAGPRTRDGHVQLVPHEAGDVQLHGRGAAPRARAGSRRPPAVGGADPDRAAVPRAGLRGAPCAPRALGPAAALGWKCMQR